MKKYLITADVDYVMGHLRTGYYECQLTEDQYKIYQELNDIEKKEFIRYNGYFEVDDWEIDETGPINKINVVEYENNK